MTIMIIAKWYYVLLLISNATLLYGICDLKLNS